ncbi:uncharacterized protein Eint_070380 [Encephalitozoon intestinalis ATCC 50506]|uniref:BRCA2 OB1 domain-containing protein n=1 Tax=Encephalitozoon intestinalis (strain ATCC 50506) TaxID=876142 RepID=E0S7W7_ENCIT|nr:uncharacterized protein Eint_070380 [Encephalitozoon intestinalis ATCC 50506]ADM11802.1 hypothetical protein Eint_070380 [Encephalitozoon intestinalis ATCC 50506]UTX45551.1 oligonucleotide/oligosaccharide-binding domain-containing protein [Encephalitozoon intestinalis]
MDAGSEVEFESFFQSSSNSEEETEDSFSVLDSIQVSCDDMIFFSSDNACRKDNTAGEEPDVSESLEQENQTFYDFNSDSSRIPESPEDGCKAMNANSTNSIGVTSTDENNPNTFPQKRLSLDSDHILDIDLGEGGNTNEDMMFSGFTTGSKKKIQVRRESIRSAYKIFEDGMEKVDTNGEAQDNLSRRVEREEVEIDPERVYREMKKRFPAEDTNRVFAQFTWAWIYFFLGRRRLEFNDFVDRIEEQVRIRLENEYSVLRRILEGDDVPWRYMILLVVGIDGEKIEVFDGYHSLYASYDEALQKKIEKKEIRVGFRLKVFGADLEGSTPISIFDCENVRLKLHYNGVRVVHSKRRLGYRKRIGFRLKISEILSNGGPVCCIEGVVIKIIETKYFVKVENYSNTTDDLEPELDRIEDLARKAERVFSSHDVRITMYTKLLVRDSSGECTVTWWNPSPDIKVGQAIRMFYLNPSRSKELHLNTNRRGYIKLLPENPKRG